MIKRLKKTITAVPAIIKLLRGKTPEQGKDIAKSGLTSLAIAGSISAGKLQVGEFDATLLDYPWDSGSPWIFVWSCDCASWSFSIRKPTKLRSIQELRSVFSYLLIF